MKKKMKIATAILLLSTMLLMSGSVFMKPAKAQSLTITIAVTDQQAPAITGIINHFYNSSYNTQGVTKVDVVTTGTQSNDQLTYVTTKMTQGNTLIDVVGMDTSWTAQFASNNWLLPLSNVTTAEMSNYVPGLVAAGTYKGTLYAYPYFANLGVLYYRADLLSRFGFNASDITTWEGLNHVAQTILKNGSIMKDDPNLVGYIGQFDNYEGGTCNFLEILGGNGVTDIFNADGTANLNNTKAVEAMTYFQNMVAPRYTGVQNTSYIIPRSALTMDEGSSSAMWYAGNAIFMRQWTFAYAGSMASSALNATNGTDNYTQFAIAPIPHFANATNYKTSEIGGAILGISAFSTHEAAALSLIRWLGQTEAQTYELTDLSNFPALLSVYNASTLPATYKWVANFLPAFAGTLARPVLPTYASISAQLSYYFTNILDGGYTPQAGLDKMNAAVDQIVAPAPAGIPGASIPILMVAAISTIAIVIIRKRKSFKSK